MTRERNGGVAQLGEHLPCKQGVDSSILFVSTRAERLTSTGGWMLTEKPQTWAHSSGG